MNLLDGPVHAGAATLVGAGAAGLYAWAWATRARLDARARLVELLALAVERDRPLPPLLETVGTGRGRRGAMCRALARSLREGASLAAALRARARRSFPAQFTAAVEAAEGTRALPGVLRTLAQGDGNALARHHRVCFGLLYPLLLLGAALALGALSAHARRASLGLGPYPIDVPMRDSLLGATAWGVAGVCAAALAWSVAQSRAWLRRGRRGAREAVLHLAGHLVEAGTDAGEALRRAAEAAGNRHVARAARDVADALEAGRPGEAAWARLGVSPARRARLASDPARLGAVLRDAAAEIAAATWRRTALALRLAHPVALAVAAMLVFVHFRTVIAAITHAQAEVQLW